MQFLRIMEKKFPEKSNDTKIQKLKKKQICGEFHGFGLLDSSSLNFSIAGLNVSHDDM